MVKRMLNAKGVTGDGEALAKCRGVRRMRLGGCGERIEWIEDAEVTDCEWKMARILRIPR